MVITIYCHTPKNNSDVIVTYSGHAEALNPAPILKPSTVEPETTRKEIATEFIYTTQFKYSKRTTPFYDEDTDSVVFVPNEKPIYRNRDTDFMEHDDDRMSIKDVLTKGKSINDVLNDKRIIIETGRVLFLINTLCTFKVQWRT
ncbi:unnamed protein product [Diatraea saccharalis]|uniref:Uncharacterized protein n=1 Tax=Diatraea saccharalis TaxID=40085 RepID=A0A9N9R6S5_9NEOP|nr:unnamed protein product [Diatraea saccharalis]